MALIPPHYLDSVVSIRVPDKVHNVTGLAITTRSIATGFLVGRPTGETTDQGPMYRLFLVTNRHVFEDKKGNKLGKVILRFNNETAGSHIFDVDLLSGDGIPKWHKHDDDHVDLAVLPVNAKILNDERITYYFFNGDDLMYASNFDDNNISTGDGLYVLGFPMGISGEERNFVIVRQGIIARVDDELLNEGYYYIDASAYPGNSGGPVIHKPEMIAIQGTQSSSRSGLIGVISAGVTYNDVAVSQQTGDARIVFTEQTGLVKVVPVEKIYEVVERIIADQTTVEAEVEVSEASSDEDDTDS